MDKIILICKSDVLVSGILILHVFNLRACRRALIFAHVWMIFHMVWKQVILILLTSISDGVNYSLYSLWYNPGHGSFDWYLTRVIHFLLGNFLLF